MELSDYISLATTIIAIVAVVLLYLRSGREVTLEGVQEIASDASTLAAELQQVANVAVASAQQLKEAGKIDSNDAAFAHAVDHVERWYNSVAPDVDLDPNVVANAVEGAYYWIKKTQTPQVVIDPSAKGDGDAWLKEL